jgi:hypothetical protein
MKVVLHGVAAPLADGVKASAPTTRASTATKHLRPARVVRSRPATSVGVLTRYGIVPGGLIDASLLIRVVRGLIVSTSFRP